MPSDIVYCNQNEANNHTIKVPSMPCWKLIRSRIWQLSHSCQTGVWEYFPTSLALKEWNVRMECWFFSQNDIFRGNNVVNFPVWSLQLTVFKYLVASRATEPGFVANWTEPGAVIKFIHFSSHPSNICHKHTHTYIYIYIWRMEFLYQIMSSTPQNYHNHRSDSYHILPGIFQKFNLSII